MYRPSAELLRLSIPVRLTRTPAITLALLALAACGGGSPPKSDPKPAAMPTQAPAQTAPPSKPAAVTTAPVTTPVVQSQATKAPEAKAPPAKSGKSKTAVADTATEGAPPVEAPVPPEAQMQFDNAVAAMNGGNLGSAEQSFRALSTAYPTYAGPLLNMGILQAKAGRLEDAKKTLSDAIARNGSAAAFNHLGIVYRRLGRFKEADTAYQSAIQADGNYALAYLNLGVLCDLYLQQPQRALEAYERYLALSPAPDAKVTGWVTELKTRLANQSRSAKAE